MRDDWVSPWWQAVNLPRVWNVCGVAVPSLSVWHTFALENIGNRYLCGGRQDPTQDDAASLLLIAKLDMRGGQRLIACDNYRTRETTRLYRRLRKVDAGALDVACREYVETCTRGVSRWNRSGKKCAVPYQFHIVRQMADFGITVDDAWNTPYALARCYHDAAAEVSGDDSIMDPRAQEMEDNWDDYKDSTETQQVILSQPSPN